MVNRAPVLRSEFVSLEEQKRLGQFFTGRPLARLLCALAEPALMSRAIDPMAGSGDMLEAANDMSSLQVLAGIEIDPVPAGECSRRLGSASGLQLSVGDAFSTATWNEIPRSTWDLVITNPPYVRYQRGARTGTGRVSTPSAQQVRSGLIEVLERLELPEADRGVFLHLARSYSGLADLAVPAWLLCAALVGIGGRLAMVVPDTWLTRDYALPVLYLLTRYFDIEVVVEDGEASWFEDALVRSTLVVARRIPDRRTSDDSPSHHVHVRLGPSAASEESLVGGAIPDAADPESRFAGLISNIRTHGASLSLPGVEVQTVPGSYFQDVVAQQGPRSSWYSALEGVPSTKGLVAHVPRQTLQLVDASVAFVTLEFYGWEVGQGLRTGANRFFYASCIEESADEAVVVGNPIISTDSFAVPRDALRPAIRRQQDIVPGQPTDGRVLYLSHYALPEDAEQVRRVLGSCPYSEMPESLASFVRSASSVNLGTSEVPRFIPELSAVVTNIRSPDPAKPERPPRFWYQLPPLMSRHVPDVFLARVNYGSPVPFVNQEQVVIDANFSTFWRSRDDALHPLALVALMRSAWIRITLETSGTVLGGGALKIEATHLRRLALPRLSPETISVLTKLGHDLIEGSDDQVVAEIDRMMWSALGVSDDVDGQGLLVELRSRRKPVGRHRVCEPD